MFKKNLFLLLPIFLMIVCLSGCTSKIAPVETYTHEAGEKLSENVTTYAQFRDPEMEKNASLNLGNVDPDKVGTYEATIKFDNKDYAFTINVVDTTAPDGKIRDLITTCGIDEVITHEKFGCDITDVSKVSFGLRNATILKNEEELKQSITECFAEANEAGTEAVSYLDMAGITPNEKDSTWDETGVSVEDLKHEFVPEETGLYQLELCAVDEYGNSDITLVYVMADLEAPMLNAEDKEIQVTDFEKYMNDLSGGLSAEDNLMGDITSYIMPVNAEITEDTKTTTAMKMSYEVVDLAGNKAEASRTITSKVKVQTAFSGGEQIPEGHDRTKAEQAFAAVNQQRAANGLSELAWDESIYEVSARRAAEIVTDFSHNGCPDYLGENCAKNVTSVNSLINGWMNSPGHRANILNSDYTAGAMACYYANGGYHWVNNFRY